MTLPGTESTNVSGMLENRHGGVESWGRECGAPPRRPETKIATRGADITMHGRTVLARPGRAVHPGTPSLCTIEVDPNSAFPRSLLQINDKAHLLSEAMDPARDQRLLNDL